MVPLLQVVSNQREFYEFREAVAIILEIREAGLGVEGVLWKSEVTQLSLRALPSL
jgi:hypothetical protein